MDEHPTPGQRERSEPLAHLGRQDRALAEQRSELEALRAYLDRQEERLREARAVLLLVESSRLYRLMRLLGRWEWLERRIRRALQ